ncbi:MAG TPA: hypothetical protein HA257_04975 [Candidatus Methanoperedenaceae archaeon]|nr:hypothetical protein [Candidatus Methanoperedenaceae archaeon]
MNSITTQVDARAFNDSASYSFYDTSSANSSSGGYFRAASVGQYIYFAPYYNYVTSQYHGVVMRYDTTEVFDLSGSYAFFDMASVNASAKGYKGVTTDGKYLYFSPFFNGVIHGMIARYNTSADFNAPSSYDFYDVSGMNSSAKGLYGNVFDGRYVYFVPNGNYESSYPGVVVRYDTTGAFNSPESYSFYDISGLNASAKGFTGAIFDGISVYFVPYNGGNSGVVARYSTTADFNTASSYEFFDLTGVNANAKGFLGGGYAKGFVYFSPYYNGAEYHGLACRYNISQPFNVTGSFSCFDIAAIDTEAKGFSGVEWDGQYVYFVPLQNSAPAFHGRIAQYNTSLPFNISGSYQVYDTEALNANSHGFRGAIYKFNYIYFVPYNNAQITRMEPYNSSVQIVSMPGLDLMETAAIFILTAAYTRIRYFPIRIF